MDTILKNENESDTFSLASKILKNGGLVAFPTETVYGLGGDALKKDASRKIYAAKGRPSDNPLIVHIADREALGVLAAEIPEKAEILAEAFWPGPLTIILRKKSIVPDETTGGLDTVAIRMPSHPAALRLIRESGVYIAAPSANTSGRPSPTTAEHVAEDMNGRIDMIIDGGPVGIGIESTIVDLTGEVPTILRPGFITKKMLEEMIGPVEIDKALITPDPTIRPKAPGMKYTHYSPKGELSIVEGKCDAEGDEQQETGDSATAASENDIFDSIARHINILTDKALAEGKKAVVITTEKHRKLYTCESVITLGDTQQSPTVAARLYSALRECDSLGADVIYSESFEENEIGGAIMNRLLRAAGHRVIYV